MSRPPRAGSAGKPVTIRATDAERLIWSKVARASGKTLSDWLRILANDRAAIALRDAGSSPAGRAATPPDR